MEQTFGPSFDVTARQHSEILVVKVSSIHPQDPPEKKNRFVRLVMFQTPSTIK